MIRNVCAPLLLAAALVGSPALAVQLTNRDAIEQKITIIEKNTSQEIALKPSETREGLCASGCVMQIKGGVEYMFEGGERLSIEENMIFLDPDQAPLSGQSGQ